MKEKVLQRGSGIPKPQPSDCIRTSYQHLELEAPEIQRIFCFPVTSLPVF